MAAVSATVTLTVTRGPLDGRTFEFAERTSCFLGRAADCQPRLPDDDDHRKVSRHHCLIDINPPDARIRDFGSLNGTYLNGKRIGQREPGQTPEQGAATSFPEHDLRDGDEIRLGDTVLRVDVKRDEPPARLDRTKVVPRCVHCGADVGGEIGGREGSTSAPSVATPRTSWPAICSAVRSAACGTPSRKCSARAGWAASTWPATSPPGRPWR
jgi:pSer/pThr/pTyr-binding forkhead associated (FHA) protein